MIHCGKAEFGDIFRSLSSSFDAIFLKNQNLFFNKGNLAKQAIVIIHSCET